MEKWSTETEVACTSKCLEDWVLLPLKDPWAQSPSVLSRAVKAAIGFNDERMSAEPIRSKVYLLLLKIFMARNFTWLSTVIHMQTVSQSSNPVSVGYFLLPD
jgi:hypothetical protein